MLLSIDTCQIELSTDQYHVTISRAQVSSSSRSRVLLKCWVVRKPVNSNPDLKVNEIITVSSIEFFFAAFVLCIGFVIIKLKIKGQIINRKPHAIKLQN